MDTDSDRGGEGVAAFLRAAVKLVHAPTRMERNAEAVFAFKHEAMEPRRVHPGDRIARGDLASRDVRGCVDTELQWNWEAHEVDVISLESDLLPGRAGNDLARNVLLTPLSESRGQLGGRNLKSGSEELAISSHVRDYWHGAVADALEHYNRAST